MQIALDGPAGAGKSSVAQALAEKLGFLYLDTGAMYRACGLYACLKEADIQNEEAVTQLLPQVHIDVKYVNGSQCVFLNGEDVSEAIRTPEISLLTSRISSCSGVRRILVRRQQEIGAAGGVVLEGRDTGTVVFPKADVKFFLTADVAERGKRRWLELQARGIAADLESTIAEMQERDRADMNREDSPLSKADDAVVIDATTLTIEEVLSRMEEIVRVRAAEKGIQ